MCEYLGGKPGCEMKVNGWESLDGEAPSTDLDIS